MSYTNDKKNMNEQISRRKNRLTFIIKVTFIALSVSLVALIITLFATFLIGEEDTQPPTIQASSTQIVGYKGVPPTYKKYVTVTDNKDAPEDILLQWDSRNVDINKVGTYKVGYQAIDSAGNISKPFVITYIVEEESRFTRTNLDPKIASLASGLGITQNMSKRDKVEAIFDYVHNLFKYADDSNINPIDRSKWKKDWIEEAMLTIENKTGDCYSYYSLSKAFFEYFGIENIGIMRDPDSSLEGTHYWSIVNIGENGKDSWYYYDATRLAGTFGDGSSDACLITQETLNTHRTSKGADDFYLMCNDSAYLDFSSAGGINKLPNISKEKIN